MKNKQEHLPPPPGRLWIFFPLILALISLGCGLSETLTGLSNPTRESRPTQAPLPTFTPTPVELVVIEPTPPNSEAETGMTESGATVAPEPVEPSPTPSLGGP